MAKRKSRVSKMSNGGRQKANVRKHEKRMAKFAAKREAGKAYEYKPNPFKEGTKEWSDEKARRAEKAKSSRLDYARTVSIFAKLANQIEKEKMERAARRK